MKKLTLMAVVAISFLGAVSQASVPGGCPLLRKPQTLHSDGTAVPLATSSGASEAAPRGSAPARK